MPAGLPPNLAKIANQSAGVVQNQKADPDADGDSHCPTCGQPQPATVPGAGPLTQADLLQALKTLKTSGEHD